MRDRTTNQIPTNDELPSFSQQEIKEQGKVYTPYVIIDDILSRYSKLLVATSTICDPSMGNGNFLRKIFDVFVAQGATPNQAFTNLYGFDIDQQAILSAQEYFISKGVNTKQVQSQLCCLNPILEISSFIGVFDIVIGNPPYVRSPKNIPSTYTLRSNLVDIFFEVGVSILKPGGTLIYITQDSFLTNEDVELRNFLTKHNIVTLETRYDYSKYFRQYNVAVDICLVEIQKQTKQIDNINVWRHQHFTLPASNIQPNTKWNFYPPRIAQLNLRLQQYTQTFSECVTVKKGRTENKLGKIPASYGSKTYSKTQTAEFNIPVIGEPNLDYFFPTLPLYFKNFTKLINKPTDVGYIFQPFIALPYFTSKFRFCLIEEDVLTTPLVYTFCASDMTWLLPLLNSSVTDFQIRYNTKSRDTGYEFKKSTFDSIKFPILTDTNKQELRNLSLLVKSGDITKEECDNWVCTNIYKLTSQEQKLIQECQQYWFKKHVKSIIQIPNIQ